MQDAKRGELLKAEQALAMRRGIVLLLSPPAPHASADAAAL